jgi:hypothetical protein
MATVTVLFNQKDGRFRATYHDEANGITITGSHWSLAYMMENLRDKVKEYKSLDFGKDGIATTEVDW